MRNREEIYEDIYQKPRQFSFGRNWRSFVDTSLNAERIEDAKRSLLKFLGGQEELSGKTFIDIGCGSGLFSLAAYQLGAREVVSVDVDDASIDCVQQLWKSAGSPPSWRIVQGSALDAAFMSSLGRFDVVYSWGVLHHTGNMYTAFDAIAKLLDERGLLYLAIYNKGRSWRAGTSEFWLRVKKIYSRSNPAVRGGIFTLYAVYFSLNSIVMGKNPIRVIKGGNRRGMDWYHNVTDWLGGYPYEFASPEEVINYFAGKNVYCEKISNGYGLGCAEYLLRYRAV